MLTFILLFILYCISEGYEDARYNVIYHFRAVLRRCATAIVATYLYCGVGANFWFYVSVAAMQAFIFWVVFDIARNLADGEDWNYIGETASIDKQLRKIPEVAWPMKFGLMGVSIIMYYIFFREYSIHANHLIHINNGFFD